MTTTIPAGWKLLAKKTCYVLMHDGAVIATLAGPESKENAAIIARMLAPPSCPTCNDQGAVGNILTAQPCPDCAAPGVSTVEESPAAGDALDAARYRQLRKALTSYDTGWLDRIAAALEAMGLDPDEDKLPTPEQVDGAFDAAQRKGDA